MSDTQPAGVPSGGDSLSSDEPTGNDATAGTDAPSGDAGLADSDPPVGSEPLGDGNPATGERSGPPAATEEADEDDPVDGAKSSDVDNEDQDEDALSHLSPGPLPVDHSGPLP
jgi:hypothetical protein